MLDQQGLVALLRVPLEQVLLGDCELPLAVRTVVKGPLAGGCIHYRGFERKVGVKKAIILSLPRAHVKVSKDALAH